MSESISDSVRYVVTKGSDDGTFMAGDHVRLNGDGSISCREAAGWIEAEDVPASTKGWRLELDVDWYIARLTKIDEESAEIAKMLKGE